MVTTTFRHSERSEESIFPKSVEKIHEFSLQTQIHLPGGQQW